MVQQMIQKWDNEKFLGPKKLKRYSPKSLIIMFFLFVVLL